MLNLIRILFVIAVLNVITKNNLFPGVSAFYGEYADMTMDVAVKLKCDFSDEYISDLFGESHDLQKIAEIKELSPDCGGLYHFRIRNPEFYESDMDPNQIGVSKRGHRTKRHVDDRLENIKRDDRVEFILPQKRLAVDKRDFGSDSFEENFNDLLDRIDERDDNTEYISSDDLAFIENLEKTEELETERRKEMLDHLMSYDIHLMSNDKDQGVGKQDSTITRNLPDEINFNDVLYRRQWNLINDGQMNLQPYNDMNVKEAWLKGYTGDGVNIVIIDDGLDHEHPDIQSKYRPDISADFNSRLDPNDKTEEGVNDPMPGTFDERNNHGTKCAGAAAAKADNSICGVGVAYNADIGAIRILDGVLTDIVEARAILYAMEKTDIKTMSWGPLDNGEKMEKPPHFLNQALDEITKTGRSGKGTLLVWASGNGGLKGDDCGADGFVSNINAIAIGAINQDGLSPYYAEHCPSQLAVIHTGGASQLKPYSQETGRYSTSTTDVRGECSSSFTGTSASAPLAAGIFALVLEANSELSYRDVMHIVARTARIPNLYDIKGWIINGANYHVNEVYGFGALDAAGMIDEAQKWENVPKREKCVIQSEKNFLKLSSGNIRETDIVVSVEDCDTIDFLEHVVANISFNYTVRGEVKLTLISPSGTPSELLSHRQKDTDKTGIKDFPFMTVFNWGENPLNKWRLIIETLEDTENSKKIGSLDSFELILYGFKMQVGENNGEKKNQVAYIPEEEHIKKIFDSEYKKSREPEIVHKRDFIKQSN